MRSGRRIGAIGGIALGGLLLAAAIPAAAQTAPQAVPAQPYKAVTIVPPKPLADPGFDALRRQLGEVAKRKDRAALARLTVAKGFFWDRDSGDAGDKRKPGIDTLTSVLGLGSRDSAGWEILLTYADEETVSESPDHKGAMCAPADPGFDGKAFDSLLDATQTDVSEWGYPASAGIEVHSAPQASAPVIEKLGFYFVRVVPESSPAALAYLRVVTPSGKTGYISVDSLAPIGSEQLCYVKDADGWKIGGYVGNGEPQ